MEPDPNKGGCSPKQTKKRPSFSSLQIGVTNSPVSSPMNLIVCVMCAMCITSSVYSGYKGLILEDRVEILETELNIMKKRDSMPQGILIDRIRRQIEEGFHRRVNRDLSAVMKEENFRNTRDAPECLCPPGKKD